MAKLKRITSLLEKLAPIRYAEHWDNCGLQWGDPEQNIQSILVALDLDDACVAKAVAEKVDLIIVHHPPLFQPFRQIRWDLPAGRRLKQCLAADIAVYAAHTNWDAALGGVNDALAELLGVQQLKPLAPAPAEPLYKLVVFVPPDYVDAVRDALAGAGAGWIGQYSHCTFQAEGTGTFKPLPGSQPFSGKVGELARVEELRLETIVPSGKLEDCIAAMKKSHPYEEVAYDVYRLERPVDEQQYGIGRLGQLSEAMPLHHFATQAARALNISTCRYAGMPNKLVQRVAVVGGSGMSYASAAKAAGAEVLVTGDIKYHEAQSAVEAGLCLVDVGHDAGEMPSLTLLADRLSELLQEERITDTKVSVMSEDLFWHGI